MMCTALEAFPFVHSDLSVIIG